MPWSKCSAKHADGTKCCLPIARGSTAPSRWVPNRCENAGDAILTRVRAAVGVGPR